MTSTDYQQHQCQHRSDLLHTSQAKPAITDDGPGAGTAGGRARPSPALAPRLLDVLEAAAAAFGPLRRVEAPASMLSKAREECLSTGLDRRACGRRDSGCRQARRACGSRVEQGHEQTGAMQRHSTSERNPCECARSAGGRGPLGGQGVCVPALRAGREFLCLR